MGAVACVHGASALGSRAMATRDRNSDDGGTEKGAKVVPLSRFRASLARARVRPRALAPPQEPQGHFYPTPDTFYLLDILPEGDAGRRVERFVDWLYRADLDLARRVIMSAKWGLTSDLEELALRWRSGRVADLGYIDYYE